MLLKFLKKDPTEGRDPVRDYEVLMQELAHFDPQLAQRPMIVALSQTDRTDVREAFPQVRSELRKRGIELRLVSAVTGEGMKELVHGCLMVNHSVKYIRARMIVNRTV